jgi:hypothetical protein
MQLLERDLIEWRRETVAGRGGAIRDGAAKGKHGVLRVNVVRDAKELHGVKGTPLAVTQPALGRAITWRTRVGVDDFTRGDQLAL